MGILFSDTGLLLAVVGLVVAGLASVLGIWMERDPTRPARWAYLLSLLIVAATIVSLFQSIQDARDSATMEEDMARMLQSLDRLSKDSPELTQFLSKEMEAQSRANPDVIQKVAARVTAEGGDPAAMLGKHLPASDMKGSGVKPTPGAVSTNTAELQKLRSEISTLKKQLGTASAAEEALATAQKEAEKAKKKVEDLEQEVEKLEKANKKLKAGTKATGTRWEKG